MKGLVSVVIPVYNVKKYLDECMESVVNQSYRNLEIIIVDDGSTDGSGEACDEWGRKDSRIKVIHRENGGLSVARNTGIEASTGEFIAFIDSDDYFEQNAIEVLYNCATSLNADLTVGQGLRVDENGNRIKEGQYADKYEPKDEEKILSEEEFWRCFSNNLYFVVAWSKLYRRELFDGVRFPEGKINEDYAIARHIVQKAKVISSTGKRIYKYRIRQGSIMRTAYSEKNLFLLREHIDLINYILEKNFSSESKYYICRIQFFHAMEKMSKCFKFLGKDKLLKRDLISICREYRPIAAILRDGIDGSIKPDLSTRLSMQLFLISRRVYFLLKDIKNKGEE